MVGSGPLAAASPVAGGRAPRGGVLRTWQFSRALHDAGHAVDTVTLPAEGTSPALLEAGGPGLVTPGRRGGIAFSNINTVTYPRAVGALQEIASRKPYDALVGVGMTACVLLSRLHLKLPAWFDLGEAPAVAEAQARGRQVGSDDGLKTAWARQRAVLRRGDRFSCASHRRMFALVGELGALGRLNRFTFDHQFANVIAPAAPDAVIVPPPPAPDATNPDGEGPLKGGLTPPDALVALWTGAWRGWNDPRTLASALSLAMEAQPRLHFVCAGGGLPGLDEGAYATFEAEVKRTGFRDRCHLLGWVGDRRLAELLRDGDCGVLAELPCYATALGAPARLAVMMGAGLPIVTTGGGDMADAIAGEDLGIVTRLGQAHELADGILRAVNDRPAALARAARAKEWARANLSYETTCRALVRWAADPQPAPDNLEKARVEPGTPVLGQVALNPLETEALNAERNLADELAKTKAELEHLKSQPLVRMVRKSMG